jgi:hypothetical protein
MESAVRDLRQIPATVVTGEDVQLGLAFRIRLFPSQSLRPRRPIHRDSPTSGFAVPSARTLLRRCR